MTDLLDPFILQVVTLKGPTAVVVFLIFLGYTLKMISAFPNRFIPIVNFVVGPLLTPIMVAWPVPGSMDPGLRWPEYAAWASSIMAGFLLACIAWIMHAKFLSKIIDDKIPEMNPGRTQEKTTVESVVTNEAGERTVTDEKIVTVDVEPTAGVKTDTVTVEEAKTRKASLASKDAVSAELEVDAKVEACPAGNPRIRE